MVLKKFARTPLANFFNEEFGMRNAELAVALRCNAIWFLSLRHTNRVPPPNRSPYPLSLRDISLHCRESPSSEGGY